MTMPVVQQSLSGYNKKGNPLFEIALQNEQPDLFDVISAQII